jgi:hypothetical protein
MTVKSANARFAILSAAMALSACGNSQAPAASGGQPTGGPALSGGTQVETIADPTMNGETAFTVTTPANWNFQGVLLQGGPATCDSYFLISWRSASPDGQSMMEQMPQMLWAYGDGPKPANGCLPIDAPMSAEDFLRNHLAKILQLTVGADAPLSDVQTQLVQQARTADANAASFYASRNLPAPQNTLDIAQVLVSSTRGGQAMSGRLTAYLHCTQTTRAGMTSMLPGMPDRPAQTLGKCTADVVYLNGPANQYASLAQAWDAPGMGAKQNTDWGNAWVKRYAQQGDLMNRQLIATEDAKFAAQRQEIAHTMAVQQQVHDQFLATMEQGTRDSIAGAYANMNARSTAASDMVDLSLDRQTVMDTSTGQIGRLPDQVTPGGALQRVHGNGTPF